MSTVLLPFRPLLLLLFPFLVLCVRHRLHWISLTSLRRGKAKRHARSFAAVHAARPGFLALFQKQAENIVLGAAAFVHMLERYTGVPEQVQSIKAIEHTGDEITHQIFRMLNQTFITPFDREDIHELASTMDYVIDLVDAAASRFVLYRVRQVRSGTVELVKVLAAATVETKEAVYAVQSPDKSLHHVIEINRWKTRATASAAR